MLANEVQRDRYLFRWIAVKSWLLLVYVLGNDEFFSQWSSLAQGVVILLDTSLLKDSECYSVLLLLWE